ncbi:Aldehyde dehydrogenase family 2 member B7, mitochondrial [Smittium culicis]|uniref:Aldehyde dehydrogenase family 2 member B7, mitochondrial n=1 Tax=Smittium culicis TaxID=133412 RepID=A0A1R1WZK7_9FUNG|nr:Aldehyde dehydrogenase family 2 member B7, mitochondrial [Smittium culicis]OMJ16121.1 Aldehyde dehydrogenase family 2 member B7, mitochondrial [Smittium culicis]
MTAISALKNANHMYINGSWVEASGASTSQVLNPTNGEVVATINDGSVADMDAAVKAAHHAFTEGPWYNEWTGMQRRDALLKIAQAIDDNAAQIAHIESLQTGKPIGNAMYEVAHGSEVFRYFAGLADKQHGRHNVPNHDQAYSTYTLKEPLGVIGLITAFNFPFILAIWKIAPALTTGNVVILKPSPNTPLSSLLLAQIIHDNNILPPGVFNVVSGAIETGATMVNHELVDKISFTGSVGGGKAVYQASAKSANLKGVCLELGGKSPNVIMDDGDIDAAAAHAAAAAFLNTGQTCCAGTKLYVHKNIYDKFISTLKAVTEDITSKITNNTSTSSIGPLINQNQVDRVHGFVTRAVNSKQATVLIGGEPMFDSGYYYKPTVLVNAGHDAEVACEEIFGPVVTVMPAFENIDEVIAIEGRSSFGLACGIYSNNAKVINKFTRSMKAGSVWVNCFNALLPYMPFGGYKSSGIGRELGEEAVDEFIQVKSVTAKY